MKKYITIITTLALLAMAVPYSTEAETDLTHLFYYYSTPEGYESLQENYRNIDVLAPQIYTVGYHRGVLGPTDTEVLEFAEEKNMDVMPLITNSNFNRYLMHQILSDEEVQEDIINFLIEEAEDRDFIGWQFDFENINHLERDAYVDFVKKAGRALEKENLLFSVAVIPRETAYDPSSLNQNWSSAYDLEGIAKHVDFISLMSYDNPLSRGPVASIGYVESVLNQTLKDVPSEKVSLGIPFYCWQWNVATGENIASISYGRADETREVYKNNSYYRTYLENYETEFMGFIKNGDYNTIWCDNGRSIEAKITLAQEMNLFGTSAWALGQEDPRVWEHY